MLTSGTERKSISKLVNHLWISSRLEIDSCFIFILYIYVLYIINDLGTKKRHALIKFAGDTKLGGSITKRGE